MATLQQVTHKARLRELAYRTGGGVEVSLLWRKLDNSLTLLVVEIATGVSFEVTVQPKHALDAFNHPYAYLPTPTVDPFPQALAA